MALAATIGYRVPERLIAFHSGIPLVTLALGAHQALGG
jgi:hypothetical protein